VAQIARPVPQPGFRGRSGRTCLGSFSSTRSTWSEIPFSFGIRSNRGRSSLPVFAWHARTGQILSLLFDEGSGETARSYLASLLALVQVVVPAGTRSAQSLPVTWEAREADPSGTYVAAYVRQQAANQRARINKSKTRYIVESDARRERDREYVAPRIEARGSIALELDPGTLTLVRLAAVESTTTRVANTVIARTVTQLCLTRSSNETLPATAAAQGLRTAATLAPQGLTMADLSGVSVEAADRSVARTQLGAAGLDNLREALWALDSIEGPGIDSAATAVFLKVRAFATLRPDSIEALASLLAGEPSRPSVRTLASALASSGNPESQAVLVRALARSRSNGQATALFLSALGSLRTPTSATVRAIIAAAREIGGEEASAALLELGSLARALRASDASLADTVVRLLVGAYDGVTEPSRRVTLLDALGNAEANAAASILFSAVADTSAAVRAAAVYALRGLPGVGADSVLARRLLADSIERVRRQALAAIATRPSSERLLDAVIAALESEPSAALRLRLVRVAWEMRGTRAAVVRAIQQVAERDVDADVRAAAARLLRP
jgi:hypothetical protein